MGAHPYWYFVPYEEDANAALQRLREREFAAGRYNPVTPFLTFPLSANSPAPGAQHDTIDDALEDAEEDGTRSILDLERVDDEPDFCVAAPIEDDLLVETYGTTRPTHEMVDENLDIIEELERGHGVYMTIYKNDEPSELFFAGYSFD